MKIAILIQDEDRCRMHMSSFDSEMRRARVWSAPDVRFQQNEKPSGYFKLSRALEYFEGYCWWPATRMLFTELLGGGQFMASIDFGHAKDPGAGRAHGDQSHRLQWHIVSREITKNFSTPFDTSAGWSYSPLELYMTIIRTRGKAARYPNDTMMGLWARLFDNVGGRGFSHPDTVKRVLKDAELRLTSGAINRKVNKYGMGNRAVDDSPAIATIRLKINQLAPNLGVLYPLPDKKTEFENQVINKIYEFRKIGAATVIRPRDAVNVWSLAHRIYPTLDPVLFPRTGEPKYAKDPETQLIFRKDAPDVGVRIDPDRIRRSRQGFNTQYTYSRFSGAKPAAGQDDRW
jgi:hypothetical protein